MLSLITRRCKRHGHGTKQRNSKSNIGLGLGLEEPFRKGGVRGMDLRRARYQGLAKTRLPHDATAAALNVVRLGEGLLEHPRATTRTSPFLALAQKIA
jgi:hypothetical protein